MSLRATIAIMGFLVGCLMGCSKPGGGCCGPDTGARRDTGGGDGGGRGYTTCGEATCQPGQFCDIAVFCQVGCLSDANCATNQVCDTANPDIAGVSQCINVTPVPDSGTPDTSVPPTGDCALIARRAVGCGELMASEEAAARVSCETEISPADAATVARCVTTAGADCSQVSTCLGAFGGGGSCSADGECDQTQGVFHEICSGGFCILGCRLDVDCGNDYNCETTVNVCTPAP